MPPTTHAHALPCLPRPLCRSYEEIHGLKELFKRCETLLVEQEPTLAAAHAACPVCCRASYKVCQLLHNDLPASDVMHSCICLCSFDRNGDGRITLDELREGLTRHNKLADSEIEQVGGGTQEQGLLRVALPWVEHAVMPADGAVLAVCMHCCSSGRPTASHAAARSPFLPAADSEGHRCGRQWRD